MSAFFDTFIFRSSFRIRPPYVRSFESLKGRSESLRRRLIREKDHRITKIKESSGVVRALTDIRKPQVPQRRGTVMRSQAWQSLVAAGKIHKYQSPEEQHHPRRRQLTACLDGIDPEAWQQETDMYQDIGTAISRGLYEGRPDIFVVDTHSEGNFHADVSIAHHKDDRLPYSLRYFIELKMPSVNVKTTKNCGQILGYFNVLHESQPFRSKFVAILSNFQSSWIFQAEYDHRNDVTIWERPADNLVDAVIYADQSSESQYSTRIPVIDGRFTAQYSILAVSHHHFLLKASHPTPTQTGHEPFTRSSLSDDGSWTNPSLHVHGPKVFVLKIVHGGTSVANEVQVLKVLNRSRDSDQPHVPELVWAPPEGGQLGIVPFGVSIDFREPQNITRKIVHGLIDGLKFLHSLGIVHRDIRPTNLILDYTKREVNVVIIDYETAVVLPLDSPVEYSGGFVCWPKRLLESGTEEYVPEPTDDLFASILLVLHMLFPLHFDAFRASHIGPGRRGMVPSKETLCVLKLWRDEESCLWKRFVVAAKGEVYQ